MPNVISLYTYQPCDSPNKKLHTVTSFLKSEDLWYSIECNPNKVMTFSRGKASVINGFVLVVNEYSSQPTVILNIYDLVRYVTDNGLRQC